MALVLYSYSSSYMRKTEGEDSFRNLRYNSRTDYMFPMQMYLVTQTSLHFTNLWFYIETVFLCLPVRMSSLPNSYMAKGNY